MINDCFNAVPMSSRLAQYWNNVFYAKFNTKHFSSSVVQFNLCNLRTAYSMVCHFRYIIFRISIIIVLSDGICSALRVVDYFVYINNYMQFGNLQIPWWLLRGSLIENTIGPLIILDRWWGHMRKISSNQRNSIEIPRSNVALLKQWYLNSHTRNV